MLGSRSNLSVLLDRICLCDVINDYSTLDAYSAQFAKRLKCEIAPTLAGILPHGIFSAPKDTWFSTKQTCDENPILPELDGNQFLGNAVF